MPLLGLAVVLVAVSVGMSLRASRRLPAHARIPVHADGRFKWDRYVSRRSGLWQWPVMISIAAGVSLLPILSGGETPVPLLALFAVLLPVLVWSQAAAFRAAARGEVEATAPSRFPKWARVVVLGATLMPVVLLLAMFLWPRSGAPTTAHVSGDRLVLTMRGPYKAFALRSTVDLPLAAVAGVRADSAARNLPRGHRVGTSAPGVIAGSFTSDRCRSFWAIDDGSHAVVIDLAGTDFDRVVVEVADPNAVVAAIRDSPGFRGGTVSDRACDR